LIIIKIAPFHITSFVFDLKSLAVNSPKSLPFIVSVKGRASIHAQQVRVSQLE